MQMTIFLMGMVALLGLTSCSKDDKPEKPKDGKFQGLVEGMARPEIQSFYSIVSQNGLPIVGASVLIGEGPEAVVGNPGLVSDNQGHFSVPEEWTEAQSLTIDAPGYLRVSFLNERPRPRQIILRRKVAILNHEMRGTTTGHPIRDGDGYTDFSLVMSTMSRQDILNFDLNRFVSPITDKITIVGQSVEIPSNASIPRQRESYVLPISLEKPIFRLFFPEAGIYKIFASRTRFPFKKVVDGLRSQIPFYELINDFQFTGGSVKDLAVIDLLGSANVDVSEMNFSEKSLLKAPVIASDQVLLGATLADMGSYLIPTDIKRFMSGESKSLATLQGHPAFMVQILKRAAEFRNSSATDRLSGVILPLSKSSPNLAPDFLDLVSNPTVISEFSFSFQAPTLVKAVTPLATYLLISEVDARGGAQRSWEIYSEDWISEAHLPRWTTSGATQRKKVEVSFIGSLNSASQELGPNVIEAATHVSRSSADY